MKNRKRLISLMLAGAIATSGVAALTSCSDKNLALRNTPERETLTLDMSIEIDQMITNVVSFKVELLNGHYFIKFLTHFDSGEKNIQIGPYSSKSEYIDHKDYIVTYEISEDEYRNFIKAYTPAKDIKLSSISLDEMPALQSIVYNYDPISIEEGTIYATNGAHSY